MDRDQPDVDNDGPVDNGSSSPELEVRKFLFSG